MASLNMQVIRQDFPVAVVAGAVMQLRSVSGELRGCCPFHDDSTPSFFIFAGGERWHCFGCGLTGDVLDFVQRYYKLPGLRQAAEYLYRGDLAVVAGASYIASSVKKDAKRDNTYALTLWQQAVAIEGTPAAAYLRSRGIMADLPSSLRFSMLKPPKDSGVAEANGRGLLPGMVALVTAPDGEPAGIQRTFLTQDGRKAASADGKVKYSLGNLRGGAVHLGPAIPTGMAVTEGVEDALSLMEMGAASAWSAAGTGMLCAMQIPESVRSVVIGADADMPGQHAAAKAAAAFSRGGRDVRIITPTSGAKDWNADLCGATGEMAA